MKTSSTILCTALALTLSFSQKTFAASSINTIFECPVTRVGCYGGRYASAPLFSDDGLKLILWSSSSTDAYVALYVRDERGWSLKKEVNFELISLNLEKGYAPNITLSGKGDRIRLCTNTRCALLDLNSDDILSSKINYPESINTPIAVAGSAQVSSDFSTWLINGRTSYACQVGRNCTYGYVLMSPFTQTTIKSGGGGENFGAYARRSKNSFVDFYEISNEETTQIYRMKDGALVGAFSKEKLASNIDVSEKGLLFADVDGNIKEVNGATGAVAVISKIPSLKNISKDKLYVRVDATSSSLVVSDQNPYLNIKDRTCKFFDTRSGKLIYETSGYCFDHEITPDMKTVVKAEKGEACDYDYSILDIKSGENLLSISLHRENLQPKVINKYGDILAAPLDTNSCWSPRGFNIYSVSHLK